MRLKTIAWVLLAALVVSVLLNFVLLSKLKKQVLPLPVPTTIQQIDQDNQDLEVTIQELSRNDSAFMQAVIEIRSQINSAPNDHNKKIDRIRVLDADRTVQLLSTNLSKISSTGN